MAMRGIIKPKIQLAKITIIKIGLARCFARVSVFRFILARFILFAQIALTNCAAKYAK